MSWKINVNGVFFIAIVFILAAVVLSSIVFIDEEYSDLFIAEAGILELSPEEVEHNIPLNGEWNYFSSEILNSGFIETKVSENVMVPHVWDENDSIGFATYSLIVKGLKTGEKYSLYIHDMVTAYKLFVDENLIAQNGVVGNNIETERLDWKPLIADFVADGDEIEIIVQMSNYHYFPGGLWREIKIGKPENIEREREANIIRQIVMFGGLLMIGVYNFSLFLLNRKERAAFYFSIFSFIVAARILFTGERVINILLSNPDWIMLTKIQFVLGYSMLAFFILFLYRLFEEEFKLLVILICVGTVLLLNLTVFIFPLSQFKIFDNIYGAIAIFFLSYILYVLIKAIRNKRQGSVFSFVGLAFVLSSTLLDMILPSGNNIIAIGIFIFMIFQSLVIAEKYSFISSENELLYHTSTRDVMTNLFKKEHFVKLTSNFIQNSYGKINHSVIFVDIDNFKVINDTYGHDVGDEFIISIAERIIRSLRNSDISCRYGGDEFLIWIDNTELEEIKMVARRLLENISEPILFQDDKISVSVSMGISVYPNDGTDIKTLIKKSDKRMYKAKSKGKNQFVIEDVD